MPSGLLFGFRDRNSAPYKLSLQPWGCGLWPKPDSYRSPCRNNLVIPREKLLLERGKEGLIWRLGSGPMTHFPSLWRSAAPELGTWVRTAWPNLRLPGDLRPVFGKGRGNNCACAMWPRFGVQRLGEIRSLNLPGSNLVPRYLRRVEALMINWLCWEWNPGHPLTLGKHSTAELQPLFVFYYVGHWSQGHEAERQSSGETGLPVS